MGPLGQVTQLSEARLAARERRLRDPEAEHARTKETFRRAAYAPVERELRALRVAAIHVDPSDRAAPFSALTEDDREASGATLLDAFDTLKEQAR